MITESPKHEANGSEFDESQRGLREIFKILGEPAASVEPGEGPLDDPAFGQDFETLGLIGALDDFHLELRQHFGEGLLKLRSLIAAVGKELFQKWEQAEQRRQQKDAAAAVLYIGWMNDGVQQKTKRIYKNMPFLALDLLSCIVAIRVDRAPPFSALFTL
jgi:hypothetical protein